MVNTTPMPIQLPSEPIGPSRTNPKVLLIYGPPKVGKTSELIKFKDTLLVDIEQGSDYVSGLKVKANNLLEFIELLNLLHANKGKYKRGILDTVDKLEEWCEGSATQVYKASTVGKNFKDDNVLKLEKGAGYLWLRMEFKKYLEMFIQCFDETILVAHIRDNRIIAEDKVLMSDGTFKATKGFETNHADIDLTGKLRSIVCARADAIGKMNRDLENKLWISFQGNDNVNCGGRCEHLKGKVIEFKSEKDIYI